MDSITTLAIDPGQGWAIFDGAKLRECGVADNAEARHMVVEGARHRRGNPLAPIVVVMEVSNGHAAGKRRGGRHQRLTPKTCFGMGEGQGRWLEALEVAGYRADHVIKIEGHRWQKAAGVRGDTKTQSVARVIRRWFKRPIDLPDHAADAVNVGEYAIQIGEVERMAKTIARAKRGVKTEGAEVWRPEGGQGCD